MKMKNKNLLVLAIIVIISTSLVLIVMASGNYTKQDFTLNNETRIYLELETDYYYNGSISITVNMGENVTATLNSETKVISMGETKKFDFTNVTSLTFTLSSEGASQGYFELNLNIDYNTDGTKPIYITLAVLGGFFFLAAVISYYIRSKKLETKPEDEDEELTDPETLRKRREAAGAEQKYWSMDKKQ